MEVLKCVVVKYVLPAALVVLLLAVSGSFMTIRFGRTAVQGGGLEQKCGEGAVIYDSFAPSRVPGLSGAAGYTSSLTVVTVVGGTISSSLCNLVLPAGQYPA